MKTKLPIFLILLTGLISCNNDQFWPEEKSPENIYKAVTNDLLSRPDYMMINYPEKHAVHYSEVATAYGAAKLAGFLKDEEALNSLSERYMKVITDSIGNTANHVDVNVYGILPLELYMQGEDEVFFEQGIELADVQWQDPWPNGLTNQTRYWIDDVFMVGSLQIQAYRATGKQIYLDRAANVIVAYLEKLQRPNGLFFHGEDAHFFWGRGNGWVASGLTEIISELPEDHPQYPIILNGYRKMMNALLDYQAEDGMWRQLIDVDSAWKETSSSAMFGYAMTVGVNRGILPAKEFKPAYQKTWLTLCDYISEEGKISDVCIGTGKSQYIEFYLSRPTITGDFHGQAPILWFARALLGED